MSMLSRLQARAEALLAAGKKEDARRLLTAVLQQDPHNEAAWARYRATNPTPGARRQLEQQIRQQHPDFPSSGERPSSPPSPSQTNGRLTGQEILFVLLAGVIGLAIVGLIAGVGLPLYGAGQQAQFQSAALQQELDELQERYQTMVLLKADLSQNYNQLRTEHHTLQQNFQSLNSEHQLLQGSYASLKADYNTLKADYDTVIARFQSLQETHNQLVAAHNQLAVEHDNLVQAYDYLYDEYGKLENRSIQPPYITVNGRRVYMAFYRTNGQIVRWDIGFDYLEEAIRRGHRARLLNALFSHVRLNVNGESVSAPDFRDFVDPEPFRGVMADLYRQSPSDDAFVREVWYIVTQLTTYTNETLEVPRYPLETLLAGGGDCEDSSILVASMLKAAPVDWQVDLVYMDGRNPYDPVTGNHVIVYVNTHRQQYWIETTSDQFMEPYGEVVGWYFTVE